MKNFKLLGADCAAIASTAFLFFTPGCRTVSSENKSALNRAAVGGMSCPWQSSKDVVIPPQTFGEQDAERILTQEEIQEDIACLVDLLDKQYAAGDYYKSLGRDISMQSRARKIAENTAPISNYAFLSTIFDTVHKDAYDGHLHYWLMGDAAAGKPALHKASERTVPHLLAGRVTNISHDRFTFSYKDSSGTAKSIDLSRCDKMSIQKITANGTDIFNGLIGSFPPTSNGARPVTCKPSDPNSPDFVQNSIPFTTSFTPNSTGKRVTWEQKPGGILYVRVWEIGQRDQNGKWSPEQEQLLQILMAMPTDQKLIIDYRATQTGDSTY
ncbi:MAG: hypothetical protein NTV34_12230, partial [Proteobacteria bacterium]|nr:hypothetical protein [Pseudomonadota bacterium]